MKNVYYNLFNLGFHKEATQKFKFNVQQSCSALWVLSNLQRVFWNLLTKFQEKLKIKFITIENVSEFIVNV